MPGPIDVGTAAVLGAVQGATVFLPFSSSGHVSLGAMLFGISDDMPLSMVILLHFGTLIATIALFRQDVLELLKSLGGLRDPKAWMETEQGQLVAGILLASVPTAVIGLGLEEHVEAGTVLYGEDAVALGLYAPVDELHLSALALASNIDIKHQLCALAGAAAPRTTPRAARALATTARAPCRRSAAGRHRR